MLALEDLRVRRLVAALLDSGHVLVGGGEDAIALRKETGLVWLALAHEGRPLELPKLAEVGAATAVAVGGGPERQAELKKARPRLTQGPVTLAHVGDDGAVWIDGARKTAATELLARVSELPDPEPEAFRARLSEAVQSLQAQHAEAQAFQGVLKARPPIATYALLVVIAVFFVMELAFGGAETRPTLIRLGALIRGEPLETGWFRMLSCSFLHAGFMHLAFNSYVLWALGKFLEPILGTPRYVVLYVLSCLGGSLASTLLLGEGFSVGASGAIWGLLAAEAVLAYRPGGLLPQAILPSLKKAAMVNLALNVVNSFRPQVDWAAHAGGGVVGGLLIFLGLLTVGLPRLGEAEGADGEGRDPVWLKPLAASLGVLLLGASAYAVLQGQAWRLDSPPALATVELTQVGLQIEAPTGLQETERFEPGSGAEQRVLGDLLRDPAVVDILAGRYAEPRSTEEVQAELDGLLSALEKGEPKGARRLSGPTERQVEGAHYVRYAYSFESGVMMERVGVVTPDHFARVDVIAWPQFYSGAYEGVAERMVESVR